MKRTYLLATGLVTLGLLGSLAVTAGYAMYLRSNGVREAYARKLSDRLGLPSDIGAVVPRSWRSAAFQQVLVWLPERRGRALTCRQAVVRTLPDQAPDYEIIIEGGTCELSTRSWLRDDYRYVVDSGLRPGFSPDGPRRVSFGNMDVVFNREGFRAKLQDAGGYVEFLSAERGVATVLCRALNDHATPQPVLLTAAFQPAERGVRFDQIELSVPEIPLDHLNLSPLTGRDFCSGTFSGELTYAERDDGRELVVRGRCDGLELPDLTSGWLPARIEGRCPEMTLEELRLLDRQPVALRFRGRLEEVDVGELLGALDLPAIDGRFSLDIGRADLHAEGIRDLVASGSGSDLVLQTITAAIGQGDITGNLQVRIDDLAVVDNRLKSLKVTIRIDDEDGRSNWIEGRLLREIATRAGTKIPQILRNNLPARIEYNRFGMRLEVRDEKLVVQGLGGDGPLLYVRAFGFNLPIPAPDETFDLTPLLNQARARLRDLRAAAATGRE